MGGSSVSMGNESTESRREKIRSEASGNFFYGRRYYVERTRFWGYLRKPRESANTAKLVVFSESQKHNPDRYHEDGPSGQRYGMDNNYEYKIYGSYTGRKVYEPNTNQVLPEFRLSSYELVDKKPGWLFSPNDRYNSKALTMSPR